MDRGLEVVPQTMIFEGLIANKYKSELFKCILSTKIDHNGRPQWSARLT